MQSYRRRKPSSNGSDKPHRHGTSFGEGLLPDPDWTAQLDRLIGEWDSLSPAERGERAESFLADVAATDPALAATFRAELVAAEAPAPDASDPDPAGWPAWTDQFVWEPNDGLADPADADEDQGDEEPGELLPLDAWILAQAEKYQKLANDAGFLIGETLRGLAEMVRITGATTPAVAMDRLEALDAAALAARWADACN